MTDEQQDEQTPETPAPDVDGDQVNDGDHVEGDKVVEQPDGGDTDTKDSVADRMDTK